MAAGTGMAATRSKMGVATTCFLTARRPSDPLEFLEYCNSLGAGGIQAAIPNGDLAVARKIRARSEQLGMYVETMAPLPKDGNTELFEKHVLAAKEAGAIAMRTGCLSGRRYETFNTIEDWRSFVNVSKRSVAAAVPVLEKHKFPMALENHKDWTVEEMLALLKEHSSEYFGVLMDTGNNLSLLDDPMQLVEAFAPYTAATHLKDMGVEENRTGFLLSEMVLGQGFLDIARIVATVRSKRPKTRITLEMISRNPLDIPCLTDKYWVTFPDRKGIALARTLSLVRAKTQKLPRMDGMDKPAQLKWEEDNVKASLAFANQQLQL